MLVEPVNIIITQSLRDDGVDVLLELLSSNIKIGFQIKSYNDIKEKLFTRKIKAQISTSRKHDLKRLFVCLCGDLTDISQFEKMAGISSEISEMNKSDNYCIVLSPLKMIQIFDSYSSKKHPLTYSKNMATVQKLLNSLLEALSDNPHYIPQITFTYKRKKDIDDVERPIHFELLLKDGTFEEGMTFFDKIEKMHVTDESFRIPGEKIKKLTIDEEEIVFDPSKGFLEIKPERPLLPPATLYLEDDKGERKKYYENVVFEQERVVNGIVHLRTKNTNPIDFILSVDYNTGIGSFKIDFSSKKVRDIFNFYNFWNALILSKSMIFGMPKGEISLSPKFKDVKPIEDFWIDLFKKLCYIEEVIQKPISIEKSPTEDEINCIYLIYELLTKHTTDNISISIDDALISVSKETATELLKKQKNQGYIDDVKYKILGFRCELYNYKIVLGDVVCFIDKSFIEQDLTELEKAISTLSEGEEISIRLKSHKEASVTIVLETFNLKVSEA